MASRGEIRSLTGLRGVAAAFVAVFHFWLNGAFFQLQDRPGPLAHTAATFLAHGYLSVDLFFVLSGFVMALTYGEMFAHGFTWPNFRGFLMRRVARVYPLYLLVTVATAALFAVHATPPHLGYNLVTNIFMVQGWGLGDSLDVPAWSISTEWGAYLLFPVLIAATVFGGRGVRVGMAALCCLILLAISLLPTVYVDGRVGPLDAHDCTTPLPLLRCLAGFTLGLLVYPAARSPTVRQWAGWPGASMVPFAAIVVLLTLPGADLPAVLLFPALVLTLSMDRGWFARLLGSPVLHLLGLLSYSLYLLHFRFIWAERSLRDQLPAGWSGDLRQLVAFVAVFAVLLACSGLTYLWVEKPCRSLLRSPRLPAPWRRGRGTPQAAD